jgi:hypothetical protein
MLTKLGPFKALPNLPVAISIGLVNSYSFVGVMRELELRFEDRGMSTGL